MIQLESVCKSFRAGRGFVEALKNVSFTLGKGGTAIVVGKSGAGKSTLLNCIGGIERPDQGQIFCAGNDMVALSGKALSKFQRRHLGIIFQHGNLLSYLSVSENIAFPLTLNGVSAGDRNQRVMALLEMIDLSEAAQAMPHELSGGEIQRVAAARALAHGPQILLADEPTANLDSETGQSLIHLIAEMGKAQDCTMIIATHDPELCALADETINLRDGKTLGPISA